jgi:predicted nucleic-acid-binding protein
MVYLLDTNIIIRFLVGDHKEHLEIAIDIFKKVESGEYKVEIIEPVIMEAFFVLVKFYKIPKKDVISDLKKIIALQGVVGNKIVLFETLHILEDKNIDFVDALICAKSRLQGYKKLSFDKDVNKKC